MSNSILVTAFSIGAAILIGSIAYDLIVSAMSVVTLAL